MDGRGMGGVGCLDDLDKVSKTSAESFLQQLLKE